MTPISPEVWSQLEASEPQGDAMNVRLGMPNLTDRLYCAFDADGQRHILISLLDHDSGYNDHRSRGLIVETRELQIPDQSPRRYIDIVCRDSLGHPMFDIIGSEIATEMARAQREPPDIVNRVLSRWRRFWGHIPEDLLSREEVRGLFAELWFMYNWLAPRAGIAEAIKRWRGPSGARHDFEHAGQSVEVKATASSRGRIHRIHGLSQLEPPENGELLLFSLRIHEEAGAANTLPSIIDLCRNLAMQDEDTLALFEIALIQAGYSPAHNEEYEKNHFHIIEEALFTVSGNFPRILTSSIPGGVPAGVESVEYEINLNGFDHLIVARIPSEATRILL